MGELIYQFASDKNFNKYLEIGTWNGQGSTKCFIDGLSERDDHWVFRSLESDYSFWIQATTFHREKLLKYGQDTFDILYGKIIKKEDCESIDPSSLDLQYKKFLSNDLANYDNCPYLENEICHQYWDVVLLDGGEFTTEMEFKKLEPYTKVFILDDTKTMKNKAVVNHLRSSHEWGTYKQSNERNGFQIHMRVDI